MALPRDAMEASRTGAALRPAQTDGVEVAGLGSDVIVPALKALFGKSKKPETPRVEPTLQTDAPEAPAPEVPDASPTLEAPPPTQIDGAPTGAPVEPQMDAPTAAKTEVAAKTAAPDAPPPEPSAYVEYKDNAVDGVDFNMDKINTSADVKERINEVSKKYAKSAAKRTKGVVPLEVTRQVADLLGVDGDAAQKAIATLPGDVEDLHVRALVMRDALVKSAEEVDALARIVAGDPTEVTPLDSYRFRKKMAEHVVLQSNMKGVQTEIARALSAFRIPADATASARAQAVANSLDAAGGSDVAQSLARKWLATPVEKRGKFAQRSAFARTRAAVFEVWISGLLTSLRTHEINIASNALFTFWQIPERAVAGGIGLARQALPNANPDRVAVQEFAGMLHGMVEGFPEAVRLAGRAIRTEMPVTQNTKIEVNQNRAISAENFGLSEASFMGGAVDYLGAFVRLPGRFLMGMDEFNKAIAGRMELRAQAFRLSNEARAAGKTNDEAAELYADVLGGKVDEANDAAQQFAEVSTFTRNLGPKGQSFQKLMNAIPGARLIFPFIRTPINIFKEAAKRTPGANLAFKEVREDFAAGGARRDLAIARVSMGTGAMSFAVYLGSKQVITGSGPSDPKVRQMWLQKYQPYSIKLGGKWYPYGRLEPIGTILGIGADLAQFGMWAPRDIDPDDEAALYSRAVGAVLNNVGDKTFLTGFADLAEAYSDPDRYADDYVAKFLSGVAQPMYSSMLRDIESAVDPERSSTKIDPYKKLEVLGKNTPGGQLFYKLLNEVSARTPGLNSDLPPRRNFWGEKIVAYEGNWYQAFNAFSGRADKSDAAVDEIIRLNFPITMPSARVKDVKLTPQQYDDLVVLTNTTKVPNPKTGTDMNMRQMMNWLVGTPLYAALSDRDRVEELRKLRNDYVDLARDQIQASDPYLLSKVVISNALTGVGLPAPK
tara:strand:- start:745 stop:3582 length:2838 start_codon:yes stop_codon:yes gene_type:complete